MKRLLILLLALLFLAGCASSEPAAAPAEVPEEPEVANPSYYEEWEGSIVEETTGGISVGN